MSRSALSLTSRFADVQTHRVPSERPHSIRLMTISRPFFVLAASAAFAVSAFAGSQTCEGPAQRAAADFEVLGDGAQLLDKKTQLIWMRCIENQTWTGKTCAAKDPDEVNPGPRLSYTQALQLAASTSTPNERWRLPTRQELLTLREPTCTNPSMSLVLFPTQPTWSSDGMFWTSTPEAKGQAVVSATGSSDAWAETKADHQHHVRLVRNAPT